MTMSEPYEFSREAYLDLMNHCYHEYREARRYHIRNDKEDSMLWIAHPHDEMLRRKWDETYFRADPEQPNQLMNITVLLSTDVPQGKPILVRTVQSLIAEIHRF